MAQMLIANRLDDGLVVFRAADGAWVPSIEVGQLIEDDAFASRLLGQSVTNAQRDRIIDPNLITVVAEAGVRRPAALREAIRARGPTIEVDA